MVRSVRYNESSRFRESADETRLALTFIRMNERDEFSCPIDQGVLKTKHASLASPNASPGRKIPTCPTCPIEIGQTSTRQRPRAAPPRASAAAHPPATDARAPLLGSRRDSSAVAAGDTQ